MAPINTRLNDPGQTQPVPSNTAAPGPLISRPAFISLLLAVATLAVFSRVLTCDFVKFDDDEYFYANGYVQSGLSMRSVAWAFKTGTASNWHPLTWLSLMADTELFGQGPRGPHLTNILLHAANSVLLFLLLRRLTGAHWRSAFVAALFALHPLHVESVAWVSERKDVLSTLFGLLALWRYERYVRSGSRPAASRDYKVAILCFALSLMSKPMLVTLPFVMLLLDWWPLQRVSGGTPATGSAAGPAAAGPVSETAPFSRLIVEKLPFLALSAASCLITFLVQRGGGAVHSLETVPLIPRLENGLVSCLRYLYKTVWPVNLAIPYPHPGLWPADKVILSVVVVVGVGIIALWRARKLPFLVTGWFWYLGMLVPVIGLVQVGVQSMADRYMYLPAVGIFIIAAWTVGELAVRFRVPKPVLAAGAVLVVAACTVRTWDQIGVWRNTETLFRHAIAVTRNNAIANYNLGHFYFVRNRVDDAIEYYRNALQIRANYDDALNNLGVALAVKGDTDESVRLIREAIRYQPGRADVQYNLGNVLVMQRRFDEAIPCYTEALRLKPDYPEAHNNLANIYAMQGRTEEAVRHFREVLRLNPNHEGARRQLRALGVPTP